MWTTCKCGADIEWKGPGVYHCKWCGTTWMILVHEIEEQFDSSITEDKEINIVGEVKGD